MSNNTSTHRGEHDAEYRALVSWWEGTGLSFQDAVAKVDAQRKAEEDAHYDRMAEDAKADALYERGILPF